MSLYDVDGRPFGTTFGLSDDTVAAIVPTSPLSSEDLFEGYRERRPLLGRDYDLLWGDLRLRNEIVGRYSVGLPVAGAATTRSLALWQMSGLFGAITLALCSCWGGTSQAASRGRWHGSWKRPGRSSLGDLTARSGVKGKDEVGVLALTFDTMAERMQRQQMATIGALATAIDARDPYTAGHSVRVANLSLELGRELGMQRAELYQLQIGGFLHDVGKIGVRDSVLLKPGALSRAERELIEQHPEIGLKILAPADLPAAVLEIVGNHHERLNGTGYPARLTAEELGAFPRIVAVADVYDALTTDRPYKRALTPAKALNLLRRQANQGLLDAEVVARLHRIARAWEDFRRSAGPMTLTTEHR